MLVANVVTFVLVLKHHASSPLASFIKRQGDMDKDLFRNTLATNALSTGRPNRSKKPNRFGVVFLLIVLAYTSYILTRGWFGA